MIVLLLALTLVASASATSSSYEKAKEVFAGHREESESCDTVWCRTRADRRADKALDALVAAGVKHRDELRAKAAECSTVECRDEAMKKVHAFCKTFIHDQNERLDWLQTRCVDDRKCQLRREAQLQALSIKKCFGSIPALKAASATTKPSTTVKVATTAASTTKKPVTSASASTTAKTETATEKPFSECEKKLRAAWAKEFVLRSAEHTKMTELHKKGTKCTSHECTRKVEEERTLLRNKVDKERKERRVALRAMSCKLLKINEEKETKTKKEAKVDETKINAEKSTAADKVKTSSTTTSAPTKEEKKLEKKVLSIEEQEKLELEREEKEKKSTPVVLLPTVDPKSCAGQSANLNMELDDLYAEMNTCEDDACRAPLHERSAELRARLRKLGNCENMGGEDVMSPFIGISHRESDDSAEKVNHVPVVQDHEEETEEEVEANAEKKQESTEKKIARLEEAERKQILLLEKVHVEYKTVKEEAEACIKAKCSEEAHKSLELSLEARRKVLKQLRKIRKQLKSAVTELKEAELIKGVKKNQGKVETTGKKVSEKDVEEEIETSHIREEKLLELDGKLEKLYTELGECANSECRKKVIKSISELHKNMAEVKKDSKTVEARKPSEADKKFASSARESYNRRSRHYYGMLRRVLNRCRSKLCRRRVMKRYRVDLESRQLALFRQLSDMAKAKVEADTKACNGRDDWSKEKKETCVKVVKQWEIKRLADLKIRQLSLDKRREKRLCALVSDPKACREALEKEFEKDMKELKAKAAPATTTAPAAATGAKRSGTNAAASLSGMGMLALLAVVLAILL